MLLVAHKLQTLNTYMTKPRFPMDTHLKLHACGLIQLTLKHKHDLNACSDPPRNMKATIFHKNKHINIIISEPDIALEECEENFKHSPYHHHTISQLKKELENN